LKSLIQSVEVTYLVHATESPEKVGAAVAELLGAGAGPALERLEGHFGNDILRARVHLTGRGAQEAFEHIVAKMPEKLKKEIIHGMGSLVDERSALFIRLDKQSLVTGTMALGTGDAVRLKVKPRIFLVKGGAAQFYARLMEGA
jgi:RNA binding exosome subunit